MKNQLNSKNYSDSRYSKTLSRHHIHEKENLMKDILNDLSTRKPSPEISSLKPSKYYEPENSDIREFRWKERHSECYGGNHSNSTKKVLRSASKKSQNSKSNSQIKNKSKTQRKAALNLAYSTGKHEKLEYKFLKKQNDGMTDYLQRHYPAYKLDLDSELNLFDELVNKIVVGKNKVTNCKKKKAEIKLVNDTQNREKKEREILEGLHEQLEEEKGGLKGDINDFKERLLGTAKLIESYKERIYRDENFIKKEELDLASLQGEIAGKEGQIESLEILFEDSIRRQDKYEFECEGLIRIVAELTEERRKWDEDVETAKNEIDFLNSDNSTAKGKREELLRKLQLDLNAQTSKRTQIATQAANEKREFDKEILEEKKKCNSMKKLIDEYEGNLSKFRFLEGEIADLNQRIFIQFKKPLPTTIREISPKVNFDANIVRELTEERTYLYGLAIKLRRANQDLENEKITLENNRYSPIGFSNTSDLTKEISHYTKMVTEKEKIIENLKEFIDKLQSQLHAGQANYQYSRDFTYNAANVNPIPPLNYNSNTNLNESYPRFGYEVNTRFY